MMKKLKKQIAVSILLGILIGWVIGYSIGSSQAYLNCLEWGTKMLDIEFRQEFITDFPKIINYLKGY